MMLVAIAWGALVSASSDCCSQCEHERMIRAWATMIFLVIALIVWLCSIFDKRVRDKYYKRGNK